jgi:hypothetical protein
MHELTGDRIVDEKPVSDESYLQAAYGFVSPFLLYLYAVSLPPLSSGHGIVSASANGRV